MEATKDTDTECYVNYLVLFYHRVSLLINVALLKIKQVSAHGFIAVNPAIFGNPEEIKKHFSEYLEALRESPKADGAERIYTHGEKEVLAKKDRLENGIQVNDNTMAELANLCEYLKFGF